MLGYVPKIPIIVRPAPVRGALIALGGALLVAVMMAWVALLLWLAVEGAMIIAHWL